MLSRAAVESILAEGNGRPFRSDEPTVILQECDANKFIIFPLNGACSGIGVKHSSGLPPFSPCLTQYIGLDSHGNLLQAIAAQPRSTPDWYNALALTRASRCKQRLRM